MDFIKKLASEEAATSEQYFLHKILTHTLDQPTQDKAFKLLEFTEDYSTNFDLSCIICHSFIPRLVCCIECNKRMCLPCVVQWKQAQFKKRPHLFKRGQERPAWDYCPVCRAKDFKTRALSDIEVAFFDELPVKGCPLKDCSKSGVQMTLKAFRDHLLQDCQIPLILCPNECGLYLRKGGNITHFDKDGSFASAGCIRGYIQCRFCDTQGMTAEANQLHECMGRWKYAAQSIQKNLENKLQARQLQENDEGLYFDCKVE
ncbi:hypothetical protein FGO68_gene11407 [Halteria grandinella]|uniref:RING-type domain-containing protein n=1 Tax=Halteria grandinella TaxID=5974 RepID=A0A8J8NK10_HALGN|nr:hypothetical protein FGO68_gene11407 [Halteria grandinella]